jgi:hypothetical protein
VPAGQQEVFDFGPAPGMTGFALEDTEKAGPGDYVATVAGNMVLVNPPLRAGVTPIYEARAALIDIGQSALLGSAGEDGACDQGG